MIEGVTDNIILLQEFFFEIFRQLVERGPRVRIFGVAAGAFGWQLVRSKETVSSSSRVEGAVNVEQGIALGKLAYFVSV